MKKFNWQNNNKTEIKESFKTKVKTCLQTFKNHTIYVDLEIAKSSDNDKVVIDLNTGKVLDLNNHIDLNAGKFKN